MATAARSRSSSLRSSSTETLLSVRKRLILVITGGSGSLGSMIAKLAYEQWDELQEIRIFDQKAPEKSTVTDITGFSPPSSKPRVTYVPGSVLSEDSLLGAFAKADVVIHCAGIVETGSILSRKKMKEVNVSGTHNVVQACLDCGVRALVFTGSVTQVCSAKSVRYDESYVCPARPKLVYPHYGGSKNDAENFVLVANGKEGREGTALKTSSLRLPPLYGEGDRTFIGPSATLARHCFGYFPIPTGFGQERTAPAMYIGNAAWAHIVASKKLLYHEEGVPNEVNEGITSKNIAANDKEVGGKFYYIGDHTPEVPLSKLTGNFLNLLGYRVVPIKVPFFVLRIIVFFLEFFLIFLAFIRIDLHSPLNRSSLQFCRFNHSISWGKAREELDYKPLYGYRTALSRSLEYYRRSHKN